MVTVIVTYAGLVGFKKVDVDDDDIVFLLLNVKWLILTL